MTSWAESALTGCACCWNAQHHSSQPGEERVCITVIPPKDKDVLLAVVDSEVSLQVMLYFIWLDYVRGVFHSMNNLLYVFSMHGLAKMHEWLSSQTIPHTHTSNMFIEYYGFKLATFVAYSSLYSLPFVSLSTIHVSSGCILCRLPSRASSLGMLDALISPISATKGNPKLIRI